MHLEIIKTLHQREIAHYADDDRLISSRGHQLFVDTGETTTAHQFPCGLKTKILGGSRLLRRALRLDKCNVVPVTGGLVAVRQGKVYRLDAESGEFTETLRLDEGRNVLHQAIAVLDGQDIYMGEYNTHRPTPVNPIHHSNDAGRTWRRIYEFPAGSVRHVHGCYWDPFERKVWVFTGDADAECRILAADCKFEEIEEIGGGGQQWRACNAFFTEDAVHWIMDSPLQDNYIMRLDRATRTLTRGQRFPGPVWYIKRLTEGIFLAATSCESGPGVDDNAAHLMVSRDLVVWKEVATFPKDYLPKKFFKFGVLGFADGPQSRDSFYLFGEALKGLEGKVIKCRLKDTP